MSTFESIFVGARVYNNANLSISNAVGLVLTFNAERYDIGGLHSTSVNTERLTAPLDGIYLITAHVDFAANSTGFRSIYFSIDGSTYIANQDCNARASGDTRVALSTIYQLTAGQYVQVEAYQNSGGALDAVYSAQASPEFMMQRIG